MLKNRVSVTKLNKQYCTKNFFLTDFFDCHFKCPAIKKENIKRTGLYRRYSVWEKDGYIYVLSKKDKK